MATEHHIRNPIEWSLDELRAGTHALERAGYGLSHHEGAGVMPAVARIEVADLWDAVRKGLSDLGTSRSDVFFLCALYPVVGIVLALLAAGNDTLPLVFPLVSGFALVGPVAAVGLYEISRRHEAGQEISWSNAFGVVHNPAFPSIVVLSLILAGLFVVWLAAAYVIFLLTMGPESPASIWSFVTDVFTTGAGWAMIIVGIGVGFLFAVAALAISVVSFPLMLDRDVGVTVAVKTSVKATMLNLKPMAVWGFVVAAALVLGSIPALIGLILVLPVLGHSTWHLYRKMVPRPGEPVRE
jgi:uncharacterized membrane protein